MPAADYGPSGDTTNASQSCPTFRAVFWISEVFYSIFQQRTGQINSKLLPDVGADPCVDRALSVEEALVVMYREDPFVPDAGVDIEPP